MASNAELGGIELRGNHIRRIGHVLCQRSMTGFAVDARMFTGLLHVNYVGVTVCTGCMTGKVKRVRSNFGNRRGPIVSVLSKRGRNNIAANGPEDQEGDDKEACKAEKVPGISKEIHLAPIFPER